MVLIHIRGDYSDKYVGHSFIYYIFSKPLQSPLLLTLFSTIIPSSRLLAPLLWTVCDGVGAWCLSRLYRMRNKSLNRNSSGDILVILLCALSLLKRDPAHVFTSYLLNPYLFLPSIALSTATLDNALFLLTLYFACIGEDKCTMHEGCELTYASQATPLCHYSLSQSSLISR